MRSNEDPLPLLTALKWNSEGLIPAIVQEVESGEVLMMAWMDQAALRKTLEVGQTHFYSRSRRSLWHKGATSGHVQAVESIHVDCDADVLLVKVRQQGGACHEGYHSCFFRRVNEAGALEVVETPIFDAETVYARIGSRAVQRQWSRDRRVVKLDAARTLRANGLSRLGPGALNFIGTKLGNRVTRPMLKFRGSSHSRGIEELTDAKTATHDARSRQCS